MVWLYAFSGSVGSGKCQLRVSPVVDWPLNGGQKMATPQDLTSTYSFIGALMADPVLTPFGNNSLPLFAVALHLGVDDLASFATECSRSG